MLVGISRRLQRFWASPRKLAYSYILTRNGLREKARMTQHLLARKMAEYEALRLEIESLEEELLQEQL